MTTIAYNTKTYEIAFRFDAKATNDDFNAAAEQVSNAFVESVDSLSGPEMVKLYNKLTKQGIAKFQTKAAGAERLERAMADHEVPVWDGLVGAPVTKPAKTSKKASKKTAKKASKKTSKKATSGERKPRDSAAQFIRDQLTAGVDDIDEIVDGANAAYPNQTTTRGYVRWIAKGIGLRHQVPSIRDRTAQAE